MKYSCYYGYAIKENGVEHILFNKHNKLANEIVLTYRPQDTSLLEFLELTKQCKQDVVIDVDFDFLENGVNDEVQEIFKAIAAKFPRVSFSIPLSFPLVEFFADNGIRFFLNVPACSWEEIQGMVECGVSQVIIGGDPLFSLPDVHEFLNSQKIKVRVCANMAQSNWLMTQDVKKFFIRPEDIDIYAPYIDVLYFMSYHDADQEVNFDVYSKKKRWAGELFPLISGLNVNINNLGIDPIFGPTRLTCGHKCMNPKRRCNICGRLFDLSNSIINHGMFYPNPNKRKDKEDGSTGNITQTDNN